MKFVSLFVLSLLVLTFAVAAVGEGKNSAAQKGSYVILKQDDGREFRSFVAGPAEAKAAVSIVPDYFGVSDATKLSVLKFGGERMGQCKLSTIGNCQTSEAPTVMQSSALRR